MLASSGFLEILEHEIQYAALAFMALMYTLKLVWLFRLPAAKEGTPPQGDIGAGIRHSVAIIAMPWALMSYRKHPIRYVEFVIFHLAVALAITATFLVAEAQAAMGSQPLNTITLVIVGAGFLAGLARLVRRLASPVMRAISTPDDYFSIILLTSYLASAFICISQPNAIWSRYLFFGMTTFFLVYVPFSKISHYLLYPFIRYYLGKHLGRRGVYPKHIGSGRMPQEM